VYGILVMLSSSENQPISMSSAHVPRAVAHLELLRCGVLSHLDAISQARDNASLNAMISELRNFVETYERAPAPSPRAPPAAEERCVAIRNGGQQCSRRRKNGTNFCGTHVRCIQGVAGDVISSTNNSSVELDTAPVIATGNERALHASISPSGIPQFVDEAGSVWCAEDVCSGHTNPRSGNL